MPVAKAVNVLKWAYGKFLPEHEARMTAKFETFVRPREPPAVVDQPRVGKDLLEDVLSELRVLVLLFWLRKVGCK